MRTIGSECDRDRDYDYVDVYDHESLSRGQPDGKRRPAAFGRLDADRPAMLLHDATSNR